MTSVTFVLGRAGSGKSRFLYDRVRELLSPGDSVALIVPEQFTFETERALSEKLGGLMNVSVYSFASLARRVMKEQGDQRTFLSREGRRILIRKVAEESASELSVFKKVCERPGFSGKCDEFFTLCKRFEVSPLQLEEAAKQTQDDFLRHKLFELAMLYGRAEDALTNRYTDSEDAYCALKAALPGSFLANTHVLLDGFEMLTEQIYGIIEALMDTVPTLCISFRMPGDACRDKAVFTGEAKAYERLYEAAKKRGCSTQRVVFPKEGYPPRHTSPALAHLEHEAFAYPFTTYTGEEPMDSIALFAATDIAAEAEAAGEAVLRMAKRMRYRDIAVILTQEAYLVPVARAFRARNIPFFTDAAHKLSDYSLPRLLLCALRCIQKNYPAQEIMAIIRTSFAGVEPEEGDLFENYIMAYGIRGSAFTRPFVKGEIPACAESVRETIMEPLLCLKENLAAGQTVAEKAEAVFAYMEALQVFDRLAALTETLQAQGRRELMEENAQVYSTILMALDQMHAIMGGMKISNRRFSAILEEGFDAYEINAIPATADQVLLGNADRTRAGNIKAMFVLGANEGSFPAYSPDDGMIDDRELEKLGELGINRWENSRERAASRLMNVYRTITKPSEFLYMSYTMSAGSDAALPAATADRIRELFPKLQVRTNLEPLEPESPREGLQMLIEHLREYADTGISHPELPALYAWCAHSGFAGELTKIRSALYYRSSPAPFGKELAQKLYGGSLSGSATRLEAYNACPFRHFACYGLGALPRREFKERRADEGAFCHQALERFVAQALGEGILNLSEDGCARILNEIIPPLMAEHNGGIFLETARGRASCRRLVRAIHATALAIVKQAQSSGFIPKRTEVRFGPGGDYPAIVLPLGNGRTYCLSGRIDRIDGCVIDGTEYFRVVDYKTGNAAFNYTKLFFGLRLQLPLYVTAICAAEDTLKASGMYYMPVYDPATDEDEKNLQDRLVAAFRLKGLTLRDEKVVRATAGVDPQNPIIPTGGSAAGMLNQQELDFVMDFVKEKASETLEDIFAGEAAALPARLSDRTNSCSYCDYKSLCAFDSKFLGCDYRSLSNVDRKAFFEGLGKEDGHELDG